MRSSTYVALFAGSAAAQSAVVLNFLPVPTGLIIKGKENDVTTYVNECPAGQAGLDALSSSKGTHPTHTPHPTSPLTLLAAVSVATSAASVASLSSAASSIRMTPIPSPPATTPAARLRRQSNESSSDLANALCEPYTMKQGSETYEIHMTDPIPGEWTVDGSCNWKGEMTTADITCTITESGKQADSAGVMVETLKPSDVSALGGIQTVSVTSAADDKASNTASGSGDSAQSTAMAASGPLPTGAMAFAGGAAGLFAAVFAL